MSSNGDARLEEPTRVNVSKASHGQTANGMTTPIMSPIREEVLHVDEQGNPSGSSGNRNARLEPGDRETARALKKQKAQKESDVAIEFIQPSLEDLERIAQLEAQSYPDDEAASKATLEYRLKNAAPYFLIGVSKESKQLMGFVCGTASELDELKHSSMFVHVPDGTTLNIHSVVCHPEHRRKGVASAILNAMIEKLKADKKIKLVCLICKPDLIEFYEQAGFELIGPSAVVHGKDQWFEMRLRLRD